jgi:hypothetical protein
MDIYDGEQKTYDAGKTTVPDRCHRRAVRGVTVHRGRLCGLPGNCRVAGPEMTGSPC